MNLLKQLSSSLSLFCYLFTKLYIKKTELFVYDKFDKIDVSARKAS